MMLRIAKKFVVLAAIAAMLFIQSCQKDSDSVVKAGASGFFVVNEGSFGNSNSSVSFYDRKTNEVTNNVFTSKNGRPLGDQAQSMTVFEGKGYIVVQNSSKIEVINLDDFSSVATISDGVPSPRYFLGISTSKAYVSDWGADGLTGTVKVIDLSTNKVSKSIATGKGANRMLKVGNLVYVANSGGYDKDNKIKVIDSNTDEIIASVTTGDNPNSLQVDKSGNIWVTSSGAIAFNSDFSINEANSTKGSISKISSTNTETLRLTVGKISFSSPANLNISPDGAVIYYTYDNAVYAMSTSAIVFPTTPFQAKSYYGLAVDPFNGNIIGCSAPSFSSAGSIDVYDVTGVLQKTFEVGIAPNGCAFK